MIEKLESHPAVAAVLLAATVLGAVVAIMNAFVEGREKLAAFKQAAKDFCWTVLTPIHGPWTVTRALGEIRSEQQSIRGEFEERWAKRDDDIDQLKTGLEMVKSELTTNHWGSLKDVGTLLLADMKQRIRERPYPAFMCDGEGANIVVSRAYLDMLDLDSPGQLRDFDWRRWLYNEDVGLYLEAFRLAAEDRSAFRASARWVDHYSRDIGRWEVVADVMVENPESRLLYIGLIRPIDEMARMVAADKGFEYPK